MGGSFSACLFAALRQFWELPLCAVQLNTVEPPLPHSLVPLYTHFLITEVFIKDFYKFGQ